MNVEFDEEPAIITRPKVQKASLFTRLAIKLKLAKDEAGAQRVMLITALVCLGAALLLFINLFRAF